MIKTIKNIHTIKSILEEKHRRKFDIIEMTEKESTQFESSVDGTYYFGVFITTDPVSQIRFRFEGSTFLLADADNEIETLFSSIVLLDSSDDTMEQEPCIFYGYQLKMSDRPVKSSLI